MATKKKAAKPAKKTIAPKKSARPAIGAAKPAAAKKVVAKKDVKPAVKKAVKPDEKKAPVKHVAVTHHQVAAKAHVKPSHAPATAKPVAKHVDIKEVKEIKKQVEAPVKVEKPEVKVEVKKTEPIMPPPPPPKKTGAPKTGKSGNPGNKDKNIASIRTGIHEISIRSTRKHSNRSNHEI